MKEHEFVRRLVRVKLSGCDSRWTDRSRGSSPPPGWSAGQRSAFAGYLDADRQRQKMRELPPGLMLDSVYMQFMEDYRAWKTGQPEAALPDSQGWTEENLAFLRERYAGELSALEIYDGLEAMEKLGMLSERGKAGAVGGHDIRVELRSGVCQTNGNPDSDDAWLRGFDEAPMVRFHNLDDLLSWARDFQEDADFITGAEAMARGWI